MVRITANLKKKSKFSYQRFSFVFHSKIKRTVRHFVALLGPNWMQNGHCSFKVVNISLASEFHSVSALRTGAIALWSASEWFWDNKWYSAWRKTSMCPILISLRHLYDARKRFKWDLRGPGWRNLTGILWKMEKFGGKIAVIVEVGFWGIALYFNWIFWLLTRL